MKLKLLILVVVLMSSFVVGELGCDDYPDKDLVIVSDSSVVNVSKSNFIQQVDLSDASWLKNNLENPKTTTKITYSATDNPIDLLYMLHRTIYSNNIPNITRGAITEK